MRQLKKVTTILFAFAAATGSLLGWAAEPAAAVTGNQGYAVYRDGVFFNYTWHAAILDDPHYNTTTLPVTMAPGGSSNVKYASWSSFLDGNTYMGLYRPKTAPTSAARDNFIYMERKLIGEAIPYSLIFQVDYNWATAGTYVDPAEIKGIRCDGVVEYVYEWYNYHVYGGTDWDVTVSSAWIQNLHSANAITPKLQAQSYLTRITTSLP